MDPRIAVRVFLFFLYRSVGDVYSTHASSTPFSFLLRFSPAQAELYEAVLEVQRSCLSLCSPGVSLDHIYSTMLALLGRQLKRLGVIKAASGDADALKVRKDMLDHMISSWKAKKKKNK